MQPADGAALDPATRSRVIDGALRALEDAYVYPDVAAQMVAFVRERATRGQYHDVASAEQLADVLTSDLRTVSRDKHLRVRHSIDALPAPIGDATPEQREQALEALHGKLLPFNFGLERAERLAGNVGYLDLRAFPPPPIIGSSLAAAFGFLANVQALIVDLRRNDGGEPACVALVASYLFGAEPVHFTEVYDRPSDTREQWWTLVDLPGPRLADVDVYVLTSAFTFSAAEDLAYGLQQLGRATIVGEVTSGGAHPTDAFRIDDHFSISVPTGYSINPITKTNWEGVGVAPDVEVPPDRALATAHRLALERLPADGGGNARLRDEIAEALDRLCGSGD